MSRFPLRKLSGAGSSSRGLLVRRPGAAHLLAVSVALLCGSPVQGEELFQIDHIASPGRTVAVELAELNGDGRTDLMVVAVLGIPPEEQRVARVFLQEQDGSLPTEPDHTVELPEQSAALRGAGLRQQRWLKAATKR